MRGGVRTLWYWGLFALESVGMAIILALGVPIYRKMLQVTIGDRPAAPVLVPALCVAIVMQVCYWLKYRFRPFPAQDRHPFLGHLLLFAARLSFIFAASLLSLSLLRRLSDILRALPGILVLMVSTFAQFCYARELEALAQRAEGPSAGVNRL